MRVCTERACVCTLVYAQERAAAAGTIYNTVVNVFKYMLSAYSIPIRTHIRRQYKWGLSRRRRRRRIRASHWCVNWYWPLKSIQQSQRSQRHFCTRVRVCVCARELHEIYCCYYGEWCGWRVVLLAYITSQEFFTQLRQRSDERRHLILHKTSRFILHLEYNDVIARDTQVFHFLSIVFFFLLLYNILETCGKR